MGPCPVGEVASMGVFLSNPRPYLREFRRKRLGRQARKGNEPCTYRLPVLSTEPLGHWWSAFNHELTMIYVFIK